MHIKGLIHKAFRQLHLSKKKLGNNIKSPALLRFKKF